MRWLLTLLLLWIGTGSAQSESETGVEAKRYLSACINAVASTVIESGQTTALNGKSCADVALSLKLLLNIAGRPSATASSRIEFGTGGLEDFKIHVTDRNGRVWTGSLNDYPKLPPRPSSLTPERQAQAAAHTVAAQNVLRACVTSIEGYRIDHGESVDPAWNRQSCQDAGLIAGISSTAIDRSLITLDPETLEGYQVTVWPVVGNAMTFPTTLTPRPTRFQQALRSGEVVAWLLGALVSAALLYGFVFKLPSHAWMGGLGLSVSGLATGVLALFLSGSSLPAVEWGWIVVAIPLLVLSGGLLFAIPRLIHWAGRERWWISLGSGTLAALLAVAILLPLTPASGSLGMFSAFYGLLILPTLLTLTLLRQRLRPAKTPT